MGNLYKPTSPQLITRLGDLWQAETQVAYRLDEWLVRHLREFDGADAEAVGAVRSRYQRARRGVLEHVRAHGRAVARIPTLADDVDADAPDAAARGLQRLFTAVSRADRRLDLVTAQARQYRDFACIAALADLHDAHLDTLELLRLLFQHGQSARLDALRNRVA